MYPKVFKIDDPKAQRTVYKGYTVKYQGQVKEKIWCDDVCTTYGEAQRQAKKLIAKLRKEKPPQTA